MMSTFGAQAGTLGPRLTDVSRPSWSADLRLSYHFLAAVDIEGFSRLSTLAQVEVQTDLGRALDSAATSAGFDRHQWKTQVSGDGELAVLPPDVDGPCLVADYPRALGEALADLNRTRKEGYRLRVRLAIHHGTLAAGRFGSVGQAPIVVSRLLDSDVLRHQLAARGDLDLVLIVSSSLYEEVILSRFRGLDPAAFEKVNVVIKGNSYAGYIWVAGEGCLPQPPLAVSTRP
jgi:class 3 adenylate cyclase